MKTLLCVMSTVAVINAMDNNSMVSVSEKNNTYQIVRSRSESDLRYVMDKQGKQHLQLKHCDPVIAYCKEETRVNTFHAYKLLNTIEKKEMSILEKETLYQAAFVNLIPFESPWQKELNKYDHINVDQLKKLLVECQKVHDEAWAVANKMSPAYELYDAYMKRLSHFSDSLNTRLNRYAQTYIYEGITYQQQVDMLNNDDCYENILVSFNIAAKHYLEALKNQRAIFALLKKSPKANVDHKNVLQGAILDQLGHAYNVLMLSHGVIVLVHETPKKEKELTSCIQEYARLRDRYEKINKVVKAEMALVKS